MLNSSLEIESGIRMAMWFAVYSILLTAVSCSSKNLEFKSNAQVVMTPVIQVGSTPNVTDAVEQKAIRLTELYQRKNCKEFFNAFPNTFEEFDRLYGFDDEKSERLLYSKYQEHFPFFFGCSEVSSREKLEKVVKIGIDGKYSDGVPIDMFHDPVFDLIKGNPNNAREILDSLPNEKAASFWYFLFDAPHPSDKENEKKVELLRNALGKNSKQSKLLAEQYKKLLVDWSEH